MNKVQFFLSLSRSATAAAHTCQKFAPSLRRGCSPSGSPFQTSVTSSLSSHSLPLCLFFFFVFFFFLLSFREPLVGCSLPAKSSMSCSRWFRISWVREKSKNRNGISHLLKAVLKEPLGQRVGVHVPSGQQHTRRSYWILFYIS